MLKIVNLAQSNFITLDVEPIGKPRLTQRDKWANRPCVTRYWEFKDAINLICNSKNFKLADRFSIVFHVKMSKSWSKKKRAEKLGTEHDQKPDIDNMLKAVMDSLLDDDSKVCAVNMEKYWAEKGYVEIRNK